MRRLLASVAALAAVLLAPSAALADRRRSRSTGAGAANDRDAIVLLPGTTVRILPVTYRVYRDAGAAACPRASGRRWPRSSSARIDTFTRCTTARRLGATATTSTADDGILPAATSNLVDVTVRRDAAERHRSRADRRRRLRPDPFTLTGATSSDNSDGAFAVSIAPTGRRFPFTSGDRCSTPYDLVSVDRRRDGRGRQRLDASSPVAGPHPRPDRPRPRQPRGHHRSRAAEGHAQLGSRRQRRRARAVPRCARRARRAPSHDRVRADVSPVVQQNLQVDATYEFTLDADRRLRPHDELRPARAAERHHAAERAARRRARRSTRGAHASSSRGSRVERQHPGRPLRDPAQRRPARRHRRDDVRRRRAAAARRPQLRRARRRHERQRDRFGRRRRSRRPTGRRRRRRCLARPPSRARP